MAVPRAQIRVHRYVPGWCEAALHHRCQGSYAGTACCLLVSPAARLGDRTCRLGCPRIREMK